MATATDARSLCLRLIADALASAFPDATPPALVLERPKDPRHGDFACNVAMQLARALKRPPREIAASIVTALPNSDVVEKAEIAGAGFINLFIKRAFKQRVVTRVLTEAGNYGTRSREQAEKLQVEFVSANPTGPLHVGHGRGAAFGASLSNVLQAAGYDVTREYYVNDAGRQMDILAVSTWLRYLELAGEAIPFPPNAYQGDYVRSMARALRNKEGLRFVKPAAAVVASIRDGDDAEARLDAIIATAKALLGTDYSEVHTYALEEQLADCRADLTEFGVTFDVWYSERSLYDSGLVERAVERLRAAGHVYEEAGALWFRSTAFGDEKDRVVRRENGVYTYFASDIAYHFAKFERGFDRVIDVWGADHHGYVPRVKGALQGLGLASDRLTVALVQFAVLYRDGQKVSMSTRSGEFVTLRELRGEVGNDAARFFYVMRKGDQHLDFDLDLAKAQSNENPVYYVQYAHARVASVHEQWSGEVSSLRDADVTLLESPQELGLIERLAAYPDTIDNASRELAPHVIAFYLRELAAEFHSYYNSTRILVGDEKLARSRLALATAVQHVIRNGLALLGVSAPERM